MGDYYDKSYEIQCPVCRGTKYRNPQMKLMVNNLDNVQNVMKIYNMNEEDFLTVEEWNKYLEEIEEIVYNITNDINRTEMEKKIENYERLHKNDIRKNYTKRSREQEELERHLDAEVLRGLERQKAQREEELRSKLSRERNKTSLIKDLMASEGDASLIVQSHAERLKEEQQRENQKKKELELALAQTTLKVKEFSSGVKIGFAGMGIAPVQLI
ncbi:CDK-activating kinase assembly factor MAT1-like 1, partial [Homarus americanus]